MAPEALATLIQTQCNEACVGCNLPGSVVFADSHIVVVVAFTVIAVVGVVCCRHSLVYA